MHAAALREAMLLPHAAVTSPLLPLEFGFACAGKDRLVPVSAPDAGGQPQLRIDGDISEPLLVLACREV
ncbi:hypothetical protein [Polaromonas sp. CG9_12]|nr:hypothetical protein [Polaromonas sp. CG9_12]